MKIQEFFAQDRLSVFLRRHLFSLNVGFTTPLSLEECKVFLDQPVSPLPWFSRNRPLQVVIIQENTPDKTKLLFTIYVDATWLPREITMEIHGNIEYADSGTHQVRYNATINPVYVYGIVGGIYLWLLMARDMGGSIWKPLEYLFRIPDSISYFLAYQLLILMGIWSLAFGAVYLFKVLKARRKILDYLDTGLRRSTSK
ncbi:MAG TPA: hypothetical protein VHL11_17195 [Phototrophicaceae bacterium]|nr:hypothetical protein [Phototrophicaceae bacterium]